MAEFTHLHLHTEYSLLDGACDIKKLVDRVAALGQKSVAVTDHGNIYGAVHFFNAAKEKGIKPILGCELYVCKNEDHRAPGQGDDYNHLRCVQNRNSGDSVLNRNRGNEWGPLYGRGPFMTGALPYRSPVWTLE